MEDASSMTTKTKFDVTTHSLVPQHVLLSDQEKQQLFAKYHITINELPKIHLKDPAIVALKGKEGDIVKVIRKSPTAGEAIYYRGIVNE